MSNVVSFYCPWKNCWRRFSSVNHIEKHFDTYAHSTGHDNEFPSLIYKCPYIECCDIREFLIFKELLQHINAFHFSSNSTKDIISFYETLSFESLQQYTIKSASCIPTICEKSFYNLRPISISKWTMDHENVKNKMNQFINEHLNNDTKMICITNEKTLESLLVILLWELFPFGFVFLTDNHFSINDPLLEPKQYLLQWKQHYSEIEALAIKNTYGKKRKPPYSIHCICPIPCCHRELNSFMAFQYHIRHQIHDWIEVARSSQWLSSQASGIQFSSGDGIESLSNTLWFVTDLIVVEPAVVDNVRPIAFSFQTSSKYYDANRDCFVFQPSIDLIRSNIIAKPDVNTALETIPKDSYRKLWEFSNINIPINNLRTLSIISSHHHRYLSTCSMTLSINESRAPEQEKNIAFLGNNQSLIYLVSSTILSMEWFPIAFGDDINKPLLTVTGNDTLGSIPYLSCSKSDDAKTNIYFYSIDSTSVENIKHRMEFVFTLPTCWISQLSWRVMDTASVTLCTLESDGFIYIRRLSISSEFASNKFLSDFDDKISIVDAVISVFDWSNDKSTIIFGTVNGCVGIYKTEDKTLGSLIPCHNSSVSLVSPHPNQNHIFLSAAYDGSIYLWNLNSLYKPTLIRNVRSPIASLQWLSASKNRVEQFYNDDMVILWTEDNGQSVRYMNIAESDIAASLNTMPKGRRANESTYMLSSLQPDSIRTKSVIGLYPMNIGNEYLIAVASWMGHIELLGIKNARNPKRSKTENEKSAYYIVQQESLCHISSVSKNSDILDISIYLNDKSVLSKIKKSIQIMVAKLQYDITTDLMDNNDPHPSCINSLKWHPDCLGLLATSSIHGFIHIYQIQ